MQEIKCSALYATHLASFVILLLFIFWRHKVNRNQEACVERGLAEASGKRVEDIVTSRRVGKIEDSLN